MGTAAIIDDKFKEDIKNYIDLNKVIYGLDFKTKNNIPFLAVNGWTENTSIKLLII